jgi:hypothetical protein
MKISLARKLGTEDEQDREQSCLFRRRDYRNRGHNLENVSWVLSSVKVVSLARQLSSIEAVNLTPSFAKYSIVNISLSKTSLMKLKLYQYKNQEIKNSNMY